MFVCVKGNLQEIHHLTTEVFQQLKRCISCRLPLNLLNLKQILIQVLNFYQFFFKLNPCYTKKKNIIRIFNVHCLSSVFENNRIDTKPFITMKNFNLKKMIVLSIAKCIQYPSNKLHHPQFSRSNAIHQKIPALNPLQLELHRKGINNKVTVMLYLQFSWGLKTNSRITPSAHHRSFF